MCSIMLSEESKYFDLETQLVSVRKSLSISNSDESRLALEERRGELADGISLDTVKR